MEDGEFGMLITKDIFAFSNEKKGEAFQFRASAAEVDDIPQISVDQEDVVEDMVNVQLQQEEQREEQKEEQKEEQTYVHTRTETYGYPTIQHNERFRTERGNREMVPCETYWQRV